MPSLTVKVEIEVTTDFPDKFPLLSKDEVYELLCRILHEEDVEALEELHAQVTGIEVE